MFRTIFSASDPTAVLTSIVNDLRLAQQLGNIPGIVHPTATVYRPRSDMMIAPESLEVRLRWEKEVGSGRMRFGANWPFTDTEMSLLTKSAIKSRLEDWFKVVLKRIDKAHHR